MIQPNFTIIVQIFNFFIGFLLVKHLLLKPAVKFLQHEKKKEKNISKTISDQENLLNEKIENKKETWSTYQDQFSKNSPKPLEKKVFALAQERKQPEFVEIPQQEVEQVAHRVKEALVKRIEHVRE